MEILTNYEDNILELITDGDSSYNLNSFNKNVIVKVRQDVCRYKKYLNYI